MVILIHLDTLEIASLPENMARTDRSTLLSNILAGNAKKLLNGSCFQQRSWKSAAESSETADFIMKMIKEANQTPEDTLQSLEAESRPLGYYGFDDQRRGKLPPDYTVP